MPLVTREAVEIARTGAWNTSTGKWNCTRAQLAAAVRAGESGKFRSPVLKRGHVDPRFAGDAVVAEDGEPALGQVKNLRLANDGDSLVGDLLVPDWLDDELPAIYPSRSVEADLGVETADGEQFDLVVTGLALLGVTKPAIPSLAELPERIAASEYTAAFSVAAGFFDEASHPRGGKGTAAGGKFVAKGDGYKGKKDGQGQGKEADDVREVQSQLIRLGLLSKDSGKNSGKDGLFGPKTEAAVKKWQKAHGHAETGKVSTALLAALKKAKPAAPGKDAGKGGKQPARKDPQLMRGNRAKKVNAAAALAAPEGLDVREITTDMVVFDDAAGRVWLSTWEDDGSDITVTDPIPGTVTYAPMAETVAARAAHAISHGLVWARGWDPSTITASLGETSVSIAPLREALGLDDSADEDAVHAAALTRLIAPVAAPSPITEAAPASTETAPVTPVISAAQTGHDQSTQSPQIVDVEKVVAEKVAAALAPIQASAAKYEEQIAGLSGELAARKAAEALATKTQILASALADGKIRPADKEQWEKDYDESPSVTTRILASLQAGTAFPVTASGYAGEDAAALDEFKGFEAQFGWGEVK